jgi:uncharacterized protein (TIGR00725 family)
MVLGRDEIYIAVIGASQASDADLQVAERVGAALARAGAIVICGGGSGVMTGASRGAASEGGTVVGILPSEDRASANEWVTIALPTGIGDLRNGLIVRACDAAVAVAGAYGMLPEISLALAQDVPVVGLGTWQIDGIEQYEDPEAAVERALELARTRRART